MTKAYKVLSSDQALLEDLLAEAPGRESKDWNYQSFGWRFCKITFSFQLPQAKSGVNFTSSTTLVIFFILHQELLQRRSTRNVLPAMDEGETVQEGGTTGSIGFQINLQKAEMSVKHVSLILMAEAFVPTFAGVILNLIRVLCLCHNVSTLLRG